MYESVPDLNDIIKVLEAQVADLETRLADSTRARQELRADLDQAQHAKHDSLHRLESANRILDAVRVVSHYKDAPAGVGLVDHVSGLINGASAEATQAALNEQFEIGRLYGRKQMSTTGDDERATLKATIDGLTKALEAEKRAASDEFRAEQKLSFVKTGVARHLKSIQEVIGA